MGTCYRLHLTGDPLLPPTIVAKLPATDVALRRTSAGAYVGEVRFYRDIAPTVKIDVPECYYAANADDGIYTLLLEDLAPREPGDQIEGCTPRQAQAAAVNLAGLHGPRWCDPNLLDLDGIHLPTPDLGAMLDQSLPAATDTFLATFGTALNPRDIEVIEAFVPVASRWWLGRPERFGLLHMDYRLDNLMFEPGGSGVTAVDWQGLSVGLPGRDLAFLVGTGLDLEDRRSSERQIVEAYHQRLGSYGVDGYSIEDCWDDYRWGMLQAPFIVVFGGAYSARSERGDRMFAVMAQRSAAAIRDLETYSMI
jgi:hypothetical protein